MPEISRNIIVPYSAEQMYNLVNDIAAYPQFLPWCNEAHILSQDEDEIKASLVLAWKGMQKSFTTQNRLQPNKMIEVRLVEGPFTNLEGFWRFEALGQQGSKVSLDMEFEFAGRLLSLAFGPIFTQIANSLVDAFYKRAQEIYGSPK